MTRVLVIGCGSIGQRHIKNLIALGAGEIMAFDELEDRRQAVKSETGAQVVGSMEEGWEWRPDVVLVAVPTNLHITLALEATRHGCHLLIEKPLSHSFDGVDNLCAEVRRRNLVTMVGCNMRFHPGPATVKRLIDGQAIGQVIATRVQTGSYLPGWRPGQNYRESYSASAEWGGAILDCIHEIDLALWYCGKAEVVAAARLPARTIGLLTDGLAEIILRHESGVLTSLHLNFVQRDYRRCCQIIGSEGTIYWDFCDKHVRVFGANGELLENLPEPDGWQLNLMFMDEMRYFLNCVQSRTQTFNDVALSAETLRVALAAKNGSFA